MGQPEYGRRKVWLPVLLAAASVCCQPALWAASSKKAAADELFSSAVIPHLQIQIPPEGMATLRQYFWSRSGNPEDRVPVPGTVREGDTVYTNVAVHLKGAAGSFRPVDTKPGLTLKFDKFAPGQRFHGLDKISLNNSVQDPTYITDKLCRELYAKAGVPVPRANYATVELNGRRLGLYVLTEGWDKTFLKRHFKNLEGNLYDPPQGYDIQRPLRAVSGLHPQDQSELRALAAAATNADVAGRVAQIQKLVDFDPFLTMITLDVMTWNWDGYSINKNNYRVFHDVDRHRLVFMPHGMDQMFWNPDGPIVTGRNGLVARGLLQTAEGRRLYLDRFRQLRAGLFRVDAITNRVNELAARIRPAIAKEGLLTGWPHDRAVAQLQQRIMLRAQSIDEQLADVTHLLNLQTHQSIPVTGWISRTVSGRPGFDPTSEAGALHISAKPSAAGAWGTRLWLEEGAYVLQARIKTRGVVPGGDPLLAGAGLRVLSPRKRSAGVHWSWFPYHESRDFVHRGEVAPTNSIKTRLVGTRDWTEVKYEIELRQPIADLEVLCELYAEAGEAWFDLKSLTITRQTDICP
jgi:spore coat protein H